MVTTGIMALWALGIVALLGGAWAGEVVTLSGSNFKSVIEGSSNVVVEFYAPWCGHCKKLEPEYEKAATLLKADGADVVLAKCDATDSENLHLKDKYEVKGYPTIVVFKGGSVEDPRPYNGPRDASGLVDSIMNLIGPASVHLMDAEAEEEFVKQGPAIVGVFPGESEDEFKLYEQIADELREEAKFGHSFEPSQLDLCKDSCDSVALFVVLSEEGTTEKFSGDYNLDDIKEWVSQVSAPKLVELSQDPRFAPAVKKIFSSKFPRLLGFSHLDFESIQAFKSSMITISDKYQDIDVLFVDPKINEKALTFFTLTDDDMPCLVMHDHVENQKFFRKNVTPDSIGEFVANFKAGALEPDFKSEDIPEDNDDGVTTVVGKSFKSVVNDSGKTVLIEFYAPWCGHCKKLAPIYDEVGEHFKDDSSVIIAKMDMSANDCPDSRFKIKGLPTINLVTPDGEIRLFDGKRLKDDIIEYVTKHKHSEDKDEL